jgi:hypothetical protein
MPRPLKTYVTSVGFYDLAVAAPSMKAALEAWNAGQHLFQQGFARETNDPAVVTATMARPGVVLRRPVGTKGAYEEEVELPKMLPMDLPRFAPKAKAGKTKPEKTKPEKKQAVRKPDPEADRKAQAAFAKAQKLRDDERRKEEATREKERARRKKAVESAQAALDKARSRHEATMETLARDRAALEKRATAEEERWSKEEDRLREAVQRAWRR